MLKNLLNKWLSTPVEEATIDVPPAPASKVYLYEPNQVALKQVMEAPEVPGEAPGYIYFVQEHMNGSFKIGKTKHVERYMNLFVVKLPFENKLIHLIKSGNHHQTKAAFHKHFNDKRLEGEWFSLNQDDVAWLKAGDYPAAIQQTISNTEATANSSSAAVNKDEKPLTPKQAEFAKTLLTKLEDRYELAVDFSQLTHKDLNRLSGYFRFKNQGALNNLVSAGVLKER
ncbi:GIY-YIG nuclease family protein [Planococcus sp. CP5-4]|uniref:GIY-YIG nuclease family protein n=1 Tax=unclassified Planococcus (in: firmicutes) TaxID=2662419 RepID=UPI001C219A82|nr:MULTISPECIES: GIY-YIG nuclease family protein [unclassified Planococcus (in: firmicutes)]MBU9674739.1 GIY-YIG nuclease family protein [Planococcus sp. CP5-4_YE]MBV0910340.1 GIY-YIG nuclease family protein [Planococcus sp. CP5-4_UN]MBW6063884.1 GIY-YIG nuclease family protein [Planococcus sp. CP5-4]